MHIVYEQNESRSVAIELQRVILDTVSRDINLDFRILKRIILI